MAKKSKKTSSKDKNSTGARAIENQKKGPLAKDPTAKNKKASTKKEPAYSAAFQKYKAAYDAGNYSLLQKLGKDLSGLSADEQTEATRLITLSRTDPTALAIGIAVVALVLIVSFTLLTPA